MSKEEILEEFEREYCNNHNRKIRWLRGVFIDQEDQIREIEKFLSQAIDQTREETIKEILSQLRLKLRNTYKAEDIADTAFLTESDLESVLKK